jgi:excisionase family DNA binding protein
MTTRQACELLAISPRVLARLVREGRIHHGKEGGLTQAERMAHRALNSPANLVHKKRLPAL